MSNRTFIVSIIAVFFIAFSSCGNKHTSSYSVTNNNQIRSIGFIYPIKSQNIKGMDVFNNEKYELVSVFRSDLLDTSNPSLLHLPSMDHSIALNDRFRFFAVTQEGRTLCTDQKKVNEYDGIYYWESRSDHPDLNLNDLIKITRSTHLLPDNDTRYFKQLARQ